MKIETVLNSSMRIVGALIVAAGLLAGCGGGGGSSSIQPSNPMQPQQPLMTATLKGAPGFVNAAGLTVYVFDADLKTPGHSACGNACAAVWPPVSPPTTSLPAPWSMITRSDGSMQLTYNGRPLYTFSFDTSKGQTNGDGVTAFGGVWHVARPLASSPSPGPSPTSMPSGY